jgi:hypothetical protein
MASSGGDKVDNTGVFQYYDMVVSVTQKTLNGQLLLLAKAGVIRTSLYMQHTVEYANETDAEGKDIYKV